jgi:divinyl protochlorophyllide a 8-vinyl-reductase
MDGPAPEPLDGPGRIGPNAVIRLAEAANDRLGHAAAARLFHDAGCGRWLTAPPERMVEETAVVALYEALALREGAGAEAVAADAGRRTGDYLLANRIPRPAQFVLRLLPPGLAARALFSAISRHAWTFAGSGALVVDTVRAVRVEGGPFAAPGAAAAPLAAFYAAVFQRLFRELVSRATIVAAQPEPGACALSLCWSKSAAASPLPKTAQLS